MNLAMQLVGVVIAVVVTTAVAQRLRIPPPMALLVVGIAMSYAIPGAADYHLPPELVLVGLLPPLLYSAAYNTSFIDFRANRRAVLSLSVGLVAVTTLVLGFVIHAIIPQIPLAAGFAIGAVIAPPDAVAATAIARNVGMPRRMVQVLEGESLVNDATSLTLMRAAIVAIGSTVSVLEVGGEFIWAVVGGALFGVLVAAIYSPIRKRITDPSVDSVLSFTIPYLAYIPADEAHASGVISVVVAGLLIGHKAPQLLSGAARLTAEENWRTISFTLEHVVFLLLGMQLRWLIEDVNGQWPWKTVIWLCLGVYVATILTRTVWVMTDGFLRGRRKYSHSWRAFAVISWASMRGVVTVAGAMIVGESVPESYGSLLVLVAFSIVLATILIHGATLPALIRRMGLRGADPAEDALHEASLLAVANDAGLKLLDSLGPDAARPEVLAQLRMRADQRLNRAWERVGVNAAGETPVQEYQRIRMMMLEAERAAVISARDNRLTDDEALRSVIRMLDVEEAILDSQERPQPESDTVLAPNNPHRLCDDLRQATMRPAPDPAQCDRCIADGQQWVALRMCLACGHVGCCDSSVGRHADAHFSETGHPVMRSIEPGQAWRWCYIHQRLG